MKTFEMWRIETLHTPTKLPQCSGVVALLCQSACLLQVAEEEEQKVIFTDRVKVKHGFIIIEHPPESGECLVS